MFQGSPQQLVSSLASRFEDLETEFHRAYWESQIEATPDNEARRSELELELRRVKGDPEAYEAVLAALQDAHDPLVHRQLEVLRSSLTGNQMDENRRVEIVRVSSAIESEFASYRPEVDGRRMSDNDIEDVLKTSNDQDLRIETWRASKEIGERVSSRLKDLVRLRNEAALALGFADFYRMGLELQELPEPWLVDRLAELEELTEAPYKGWKEGVDSQIRSRFGVDRVMPWHYADPFFQLPPPEGRVDLDPLLEPLSAEDLARRTFAGWGVDLTRVLESSDLYPREQKCQHAFCLDVDRSGKDVRILANVTPGEMWVEILLHESGHAAYDVSIDPNLPYLLRRATHIFVTEAIAILSGRLLRDPQWLTNVAGLGDDKIREIEGKLRQTAAADSLQFCRWGLVMANFERDLYSDPEGDLDERWWELVSRFQLIEPPDDPPRGAWAAKIHLSSSPVYYHNYLLGEVLASQLRRAVERGGSGFVGDASAGKALADRVYKQGAQLRWDALIEEATGEPLSARYFAADVVGDRGL
jgi:peptidyl-dipeptidase A